MISTYLLTAWRNLTRRKGVTLIHLLGLSVGMAAAILILQYISFEKSYDRFHERGNQIYRVTAENKLMDQEYAVTQPIVGPLLKTSFPEIERMTRILPRRGIWQHKTDESSISHKESRYAYVDSSFFSLFSFETNSPNALDKPFQMMVSKSTAEKYFGKEDAVGKIITLHDDFGPLDYTVAGVYEDFPPNSHWHFDGLFSYQTLEINPKSYLSEWRGFFTYLQLPKGYNSGDLEAKFPQIIAQVEAVSGPDAKEALHLEQLNDIYLNSDVSYDKASRGDKTAVNLLSFLAAFILLLAWVNFVNLTTARSLERAKEVGIRKILGSARFSLIIQFLSEAFLLHVCSLIAAMTLIQLAAPFLSQWMGHTDIPAWMNHYSPMVYLGMGSIIVLGILLAGLYPAWILSGYAPAEVIKGKFTSSTQGQRIRKGLVILQFTLSGFLLTTTLAVYQQLQFMQSQAKGISVQQTLILESPAMRDSTYSARMEILNQRLESMPGIKESLPTGMVPGGNFNFGTQVGLANEPASKSQICNIAFIQPGFFDHYEVSLLAGRSLDKELSAPEKGVIVNEAALATLGLPEGEESLGQMLSLGSDGKTIVPIIGIVQNYHHSSLRYPYEPVIFQQNPQTNYLSLTIEADRSALPQMLNEIEKTYQELFAGNPFEYFFLDELFEQQYQEDRQLARWFALFAFLALFIASLGLLGLSAFHAVQRTREIGIRKVLGASVKDILLLLSGSYLRLILIAYVLALPIAGIVIFKGLESFAFSMSVGPILFLLPFLIGIFIAVLTLSLQTLKTAKTNPVDVLRYE